MDNSEYPASRSPEATEYDLMHELDKIDYDYDPSLDDERRSANDTTVPESGWRFKAPHEWTGAEAPLEVKEWAPLGRANIPPSELSRHTLILGETGSGKTRSGILPLVRALFHWSVGTAEAPSMLVIDPKREITAFIEGLNESMELNRTVVQAEQGAGAWQIALFEGVDYAQLTPERYVDRVLGFSDALKNDKSSGNAQFFSDQTKSLLRSLVAVDFSVVNRFGRDELDPFWNAVDVELRTQNLGAIGNHNRSENFLAPFGALLNLASATRRSDAPSAVLNAYLTTASRYQVPAAHTVYLLGLTNLASETFTSVIATTSNVLRVLAAGEFAQHVSLNPFEMPHASRWLSVVSAMDEGHVVCYYPSGDSEIGNVIGKALKAKFFEYTFKREAQERPFAYVCDEFQRFITNDAVSGEQSFLDRCRAYRATCILATQSTASLRYALGADGDTRSDEAALDILFNNTGNKLFFRNTDHGTQDLLRKLLPEPTVPGRPHIVSARPVSTLRTGECYFLLSDGTWGRRRVALT